MSDLVETVIYTGEKPWWMAGSLTADSADGRGLYVGEEAASAADIFAKSPALHRFRVEKRTAAFYSPGRDEYFDVPSERFLVRTDTGAALGRCTEKYQERQPVEQFELWDRVVGEGLARYKTVGILDGGKRVFLSLQVPGGWDIRRFSGRVDRHVPYILDSLAFTGKDANLTLGTDVNTVCMNTHNLAIDGAAAKWSIPHRGNMDARYDAVVAMLGDVASHQEEQRESAQLLADTPMRLDAFVRFSTEVFLRVDGEREEVDEAVAKWFEEATDRSKTILRNKVSKASDLFVRGIGNEGASAYDALNAFTEYFDHFDIGDIRDRVKAGKAAARALTSSVSGDGAQTKERVRQQLLAAATR